MTTLTNLEVSHIKGLCKMGVPRSWIADWFRVNPGYITSLCKGERRSEIKPPKVKRKSKKLFMRQIRERIVEELLEEITSDNRR